MTKGVKMDMGLEEEIFTCPIYGFENYFVTNQGEVINMNTGRLMKLTTNQFGEVMVGLSKGGKMHIRSVRRLVAENFVPGRSDRNNTPILLNGDREDLRASNMAWRPRWFALRYARQFHDIRRAFYVKPIREIRSGREYDNAVEAGMATGVLFMDIVLSIHNRTYVWPTGDMFEYI